MLYSNIHELDPEYIETLLEGTADAQMNVTLEWNFQDKKAVPEILDTLAHARQVLVLLHQYLSNGAKKKTA